MLLILFVKRSILDVWLLSECASEFFKGTLVGHQFFTTQSWVSIPGSALLQSQHIVIFSDRTVYKGKFRAQWNVQPEAFCWMPLILCKRLPLRCLEDSKWIYVALFRYILILLTTLSSCWKLSDPLTHLFRLTLGILKTWDCLCLLMSIQLNLLAWLHFFPPSCHLFSISFKERSWFT